MRNMGDVLLRGIRKARSPLVILGALLPLAIVWYVLAARHYRSDSYLSGHLKELSHQEIVLASREMIISLEAGQIPFNNVTVDTTGVYVDSEHIHALPWVPGAIRMLNPRYIKIRTDCVLIALDTPGHRTVLLAFRDGAEEFGTRNLGEGLWFWNGRHRDRHGFKMQER